MNAYEAAAMDGREAQLHEELLSLLREQNRGSAGQTVIPANFLKVEATKT